MLGELGDQVGLARLAEAVDQALGVTADVPPDASVVRAIIDMAQSFGYATSAEGIETDAQRAELLGLRCAEGQGYLFSRPLPAGQFAERYLWSGAVLAHSA